MLLMIRATMVAAVLGVSLAGGSLCGAHAAESGRDYPLRPVRLVSPFAPGGNTDMVGRTIAPRLAERLGQNVLVDNRPGAGGVIGTAAVAKALPDGHTLLFASGAFTSVAATASKLPYDPVKDFSWVSIVITYPFVVVVKNDSPMRNAGGLVELARRNPGRLNYGSVGIGSVFHLATELFNSMAGTEMTHVPFKGSAEPMTELMAGRLDVIFGTLTGAYPQIQAGRVRALAVTSLERSPQLPDVPTLAETLPGYEVTSFAGVAGPRGTPPAVVARLNRELHAVLKQPDISRLFAELGGSLRLTTPAEADRHVAGEIEKWRRIVAARKIEVQ
jgi:tripartite-type tricarboxylate transporter receptor subunit TctC